MRSSKLAATLSLILFLVLVSGPAGAAKTPLEMMGGRILAQDGDRQIILPVLKTDISVEIQGDLTVVEATQTFENPSARPLEARYLFPLNKDATVFAMTMEVGNEIIEAQIHKKKKAEEKYYQAQLAGKAAALLTQHRPNMFTQKIANLMPGLPIKVTLRYVQALPKIDGEYELVLPLVVGPRYEPGTRDLSIEGQEAEYLSCGCGDAEDGWLIDDLPQYPDVAGMSLPGRVLSERVTISINLDAGMPITKVHSPTHQLDVRSPAEGRREISLARGKTVDNRDFVLRYALSGDNHQAGLMIHKDPRGTFFNLLIEPPAQVAENMITPREMVFVLDCSGSMAGKPLRAAKTFVRESLNSLRPADYFRIIRFSESAGEFSELPLRASVENIKRGLKYVQGLSGGGGTEMWTGIRQALDPPAVEGAVRIVVFLTDGYIGDEDVVLRIIHDLIGPARLYAFGVGTSVNRFLLSEMGRIGRGFTRYINPTESYEEAALDLAGKLETPVLTDIDIDWGNLEVEELSPVNIPDLFAGGSIRLTGRVKGRGRGKIKVNGLVSGRPASMSLDLIIPDQDSGPASEAIPLIWARTQISDAMRDLMLFEDPVAEDRITALGLDFSLQTRFTSFVAVSIKIYNNDPARTVKADVPLPQVLGVSQSAYPNTGGSQMAASFSGGATPEPASSLALITAGLGAGWGLYRRRRNRNKTGIRQ